MLHHKAKQGFSIPDMIMGLSIIAVAVVGMMFAQRNYVQMSNRVELGLRAVTLANSVMNTIRMHRFDESLHKTWSTSLGADGGESTAADYDDIDDYAGTSWDFSSDGFTGFTITSRVFNVHLGTSWVDSVGPGTDYKRIIVSVNHAVLDGPVVVSSLYAGIDPE